MDYQFDFTQDEIKRIKHALLVRSRQDQAPFARTERTEAPYSLESLLENWAEFVLSVERGYTLTIYDYTNDLSVHDILDDLLMNVPDAVRAKVTTVLNPLDARFRQATIPISRQVLGTKARFSEIWCRIPRKMGDELASDLRFEGLVE